MKVVNLTNGAELANEQFTSRTRLVNPTLPIDPYLLHEILRRCPLLKKI